jgi:hypothetical protein
MDSSHLGLSALQRELFIDADAVVPGGVSPAELDKFRVEIVERLRRLAFPG